MRKITKKQKLFKKIEITNPLNLIRMTMTDIIWSKDANSLNSKLQSHDIIKGSTSTVKEKPVNNA